MAEYRYNGVVKLKNQFGLLIDAPMPALRPSLALACAPLVSADVQIPSSLPAQGTRARGGRSSQRLRIRAWQPWRRLIGVGLLSRPADGTEVFNGSKAFFACFLPRAKLCDSSLPFQPKSEARNPGGSCGYRQQTWRAMRLVDAVPASVPRPLPICSEAQHRLLVARLVHHHWSAGGASGLAQPLLDGAADALEAFVGELNLDEEDGCGDPE